MTCVAEIVRVGIADYGLVKRPHSIRTCGLGSCVGIVIFDPIIQIGAMSHIMLPDSQNGKSTEFNRAKFADTAIVDIVDTLIREGASKHRLKAKIAGGAQMFQLSIQSETMRIGPRNVEAVKLALSKINIPIVSEDIGGHSGRTIEFSPSTSLLHIRTVNQGEKHI
jgi:chemotaxis protein CheD